MDKYDTLVCSCVWIAWCQVVKLVLQGDLKKVRDLKRLDNCFWDEGISIL